MSKLITRYACYLCYRKDPCIYKTNKQRSCQPEFTRVVVLRLSTYRRLLADKRTVRGEML